MAAGLTAAKDAITTIKTIINPNSESQVSWLLYALRGIITGGLAASLAAPLLGKKNSPLHELINGKSVVRLNRAVGAGVAWLTTTLFINTAKGSSFLNKIPILGNLLEGIIDPVSMGIRSVTAPGSSAPAGPGPQLPPGLGG